MKNRSQFLLVTAILLVYLVLSPSILNLTSTAQQSETLLFQEDMDALNDNLWDYSMTWSVAQDGDGNGVWHNRARQDGEWSVIIPKIGFGWTNYVVEFRVRTLNEMMSLATAFRYSDGFTYEYVIEPNTWHFLRKVRGDSDSEPRILKNGFLPPSINVRDNSWHDIQITARQSTIEVSIDGQLVMSASDTIGDPFIAGSLRFAVWNTEAVVEMDDLKVFELPPASYILEDGSVDKNLLIYEGQRLIAQGIGSARSGEFQEATDSFNAVNLLVEQYEDDPMFSNNRGPTAIQWMKFDALVGEGKAAVEAAKQGSSGVRALAQAREPVFVADADTMRRLLGLPEDAMPILESAFADPANALEMLEQEINTLPYTDDDKVYVDNNLYHGVNVIRAMKFIQSGDFASAEIAVARANRFPGRIQISHYYKAIILERQGKYRQALDLWRDFSYTVFNNDLFSGGNEPPLILAIWQQQVIETITLFFHDLEPAEDLLLSALEMFDTEVLPRDPQRVGDVYKALADAYRQGYWLWITLPANHQYEGQWLHMSKVALVEKAEETYGNSASAFAETSDIPRFALAKFSQAEVQWDIAHWFANDTGGQFKGQSNSYWYKTAIESVKEAVRVAGIDWMRQTGSKISFMFAWELETLWISDDESNIDDILTDIVTSGAGWFVGAAKTRLAWRSEDAAYAAAAIPALLQQAQANQAERDNWAYYYDEEIYLHANHHLGVSYYLVDRPDRAVIYLQAARESFARASWLKDRWGDKQVVLNPDTNMVDINNWLLGDSLVELGRYREAIEIYQEIEITEETYFYPDIKLGLATAYQGLGQYWLVVPELNERVNYYERQIAQLESQSLDSKLLLEYKRKIVETQLRMIPPFLMLGQTEQAIVTMDDALEKATEIGDNALLVDVYVKLANSYLSLSNQEKAIEYFREAADIAEQQRSLLQQRGEALLGLGRIYMANNRLDEAGDTLFAAKWAMDNVPYTEGQILVNLALGDLALMGDDSTIVQVQRYYNKALELAQDAQHFQLQANVLAAIGILQFQQNDPLTSIQTFHEALAAAEYVNDRETIIRIAGWLGRVMVSDNRYEIADLHYGEALNIIEVTRRGFASETLQSQFSANYAWVYADYVDLLYDLQHYDDLFTTTERARARAFLDQLAAGPMVARQETNIENETGQNLLARMTEVRDQLEAVRPRLLEAQSKITLNRDEIQTLNSILLELEREYIDLRTRLQITSPQLATLASVDVANLNDIQTSISADTTLLSYYTTEKYVYAIIITHDDFKVYRIDDVRPDTLENNIELFHSIKNDLTSVTRLYEMLVAPIKPSLTTRHLIIVPYGSLNYLPFGVLTSDGTTFLSDEFAISYLPSASTLLLLPNGPNTIGEVVAFGNPEAPGFKPLQFAEEEVEAVVAIAGGVAHIGAEATEDKLWSESSDAGVLYVAAHGTFNTNALFSALHLTPSEGYDGLLETHEIYDLDLTHHTELVVLSACNTAVGTLTAGDEFTGLNRAFLYAGAPSVLATLWEVDDEATAFLMQSFFEARAAGHSSAESLQLAQLETRRYTNEAGNQPYASPYYWGAFILTGRS